jgi:hypothetical protein
MPEEVFIYQTRQKPPLLLSKPTVPLSSVSTASSPATPVHRYWRYAKGAMPNAKGQDVFFYTPDAKVPMENNDCNIQGVWTLATRLANVQEQDERPYFHCQKP